MELIDITGVELVGGVDNVLNYLQAGIKADTYQQFASSFSPTQRPSTSTERFLLACQFPPPDNN